MSDEQQFEVQLKPGQRVYVKAPSGETVATYAPKGRKDYSRITASGTWVDPNPPPPDPDPEPTPDPVPCADVQSRINAVVAGGQVDLTGCTWAGSLTIPRRMTVKGGKVVGRIFVRASDVTIDGTEVTGGTAPTQQGSIDCQGFDRLTVRRVNVHHGMGAGISIRGGSAHLVEDSTFAYHQQQGYHFSEADDCTFRRNRVFGNNTDAAPGPRIDAGWEAGGGKMSWSRGVTLFEANDVHDNGGPGIWFDLDNRGVTVRGNRSYRNRIGIFYEISHEALIEDNICHHNGLPGDGNAYSGGADIRVSSSRLVIVRGNVCAWSRRGIVFLAQNRTDGMKEGHERPSTYEGNRSEANVVISGHDSLHGWYQTDGKRLDVPGNGSAGDRFWSPTPEPQGSRFEWASSPKSTLAAYAATPGGFASRYLTVAEKDAILAGACIPA